MSVDISATVFWSHLSRLVAVWKADPAAFGNAEALWVVAGKDDRDRPDNLRTTVAQLYLLEYEFPDTLFMFSPSKLLVWSSQRRCDIIAALGPAKPADFEYAIEVSTVNYKDEATLKPRIQDLVDAAKGPVGMLLKDFKYQKGPFAKLLIDALSAATTAGTLQTPDAANGWAEVLAIKDEAEAAIMRKSAIFTTSVYRKVLVAEVEKIIDSNKQVPQSKLAQDTEAVIMEPRKKFSSMGEEFAQSVDAAYTPVVQSAGKYDLPALATCRAETSTDPLGFDTIILAIGAKYKQYTSTMARTLMVDTPPDQEKCYAVLESAYRHLLQTLRPGATFASVYAAVAQHVAERAGEGDDSPTAQLKGKLLPKLGYGVGLSVRDPYLEISATNERPVLANMALVVIVGFQDVQITHDNPARRSVSLVIADTVLVVENPREDGTCVELLTKSPSAYQSVSYTVSDEQEKESSAGEDDQAKAERWKTTLRHRKGETTSNAVAREQQKQKIIEQKRKESVNRHRTQQEEKRDVSTAGRLARNQLSSYATEKEMPQVSGLMLDKPQETLLIPLWGVLVPFHISTIRNVTKSEEGDSTFLRFNFLIPSGGAQAYIPGTLFPTATFLKEVTYRVPSRLSSKAEGVVADVMAAIKRLKAMDARQKESDGLQKQDTLRIDPTSQSAKLRDVFMRPCKGRRQTGTLEGHRDGVRFTVGGEHFDIVFSNVKHGIIHPSRNDTVCLVHFHLRHPVMIGNKKTTDVQFYVEVVMDEKLQGSSMRYRDEDLEIEEEERQKDQIKKCNSEFVTWGMRMQSIAAFRFDTPFFKSDFSGTVNRSTQVIRKTHNCLVALVEGPPFFVLTLEDVEVCVLERVILGQKAFDMVFVHKDYKVPVSRIDTVEMRRLDEVKDWLTSVGVVYYEVPQPLAWPAIIKEIIASDAKGEWDPWSEDEGWACFLDVNKADSDDPDTDSEDSVFDAEQASESESDDSDSDADASDEDDEEDSDDDEDDEEERGLDWDEMEEHFEAEDRKHRENRSSDDSEDSEDRKRRRKPAGKPGAKAPAAKPKPGAKPPGARPGPPPGPMGRPAPPRPGATNGPRPTLNGPRPGLGRPSTSVP